MSLRAFRGDRPSRWLAWRTFSSRSCSTRSTPGAWTVSQCALFPEPHFRVAIHKPQALRPTHAVAAGALGFWQLAQSVVEQGVQSGIFTEDMLDLILESIQRAYADNARYNPGVYSTGETAACSARGWI